MADDGDALLEESADDVLIESKKGFSKSLIIKIAIAVIVLLGAGAATYLFLATDDEETEQTATMEEDNLDASEVVAEDMNNDAASNEMVIDLPEIPETMSSEEAVVEEATELEQIPEASEEEANVADEASSMPEKDIDEQVKAQQEALILQEENRRLKQKIMALEAQTKLQDKVLSTPEERSAPLPSNSEQYIYNYQDEEAYPSRPKPKAEPIPEAKWGDFERL